MTDPGDVVRQLTLEEKARLVSGAAMWATAGIPHAGVRSAVLTDGPHGVRMARDGADARGIADSLPATCFPTASALGSSWDRDLLREIGEALGAAAPA